MKTYFIDKEIAYDGSQLTPLYAFKNHSVEGRSTVAWIGSCDVTIENMKDGEDLFQGESIAGDKMLHFIVEWFEKPLFAMVLAQRLFASIAKDELERISGENIFRDGDDLYYQEGKLSISIATRGAVSSMIHFALNIVNTGTPVNTASLNDLKIEPKVFAEALLVRWQKEVSSIDRACEKVYSL